MSATPPLDLTPISTSSNPRRVAYFYDPDVGNYVYQLGHCMKPHRIRMAHNLIVNYDLCDDIDDTPGASSSTSGLNVNNEDVSAMDVDGTRGMNDEIVSEWQDGDKERAKGERLSGARGKSMQVFRPRRANKDDMTKFHSDEYIEFLEKVTPETAEQLTGGGVRCLIGEDCPAFEGLWEFCSISAGGSIAAAEKLNSGAADITINWAGGLHHAKKTEASGFCYVNDIVLGILELLRIHPRVLYIDVDVHHGDGVEEAFYTTDRVMTASFHRFGEFFPGTGDVRDVGMGRGKGYAVNVPLRDGIRDDSFHSIFKPIINYIIDFYRPGAICLQMGADSLAGDKLGGFNMTLKGHAECAAFVKSFGLPVMMLGGGGYTTKNVARAWTNETAVMLDRELDENLPYNQYMEYYGPRYKLEVLANNTDDHNLPEYLEAIKKQVFKNLSALPHAPGVQIQQVPSKSLGEEIGMKRGELSDPEDEIELRLKKLQRRRAMNGTYSPPTSDDEEEDPGYARRRRQGGSRRLPIRVSRKPARLATPSSSSDEEDPCGVVRKKRTFFKSRNKPTLPAVAGLNGFNGTNGFNGLSHGANGLGNGNGNLEAELTNSIVNGLGNGLGSRLDDVRMEGSRANSPGSVA